MFAGQSFSKSCVASGTESAFSGSLVRIGCLVVLSGLAFLPGGCPASSDPTAVAGIQVENTNGSTINPNDDPSNGGGVSVGGGSPTSGDGGPGGPIFSSAGGGTATGPDGGSTTTDPPAPDVTDPAPPTGISAEIQTALDTTGYYFIQPGTHNIESTIIIRKDQRLCGAGKSSVLRWVGSGNTAIQFGDPAAVFYGAYLDNFCLSFGGLRVAVMTQHCSIDRLWVSDAPGDGILIDGIGERLVFRDVVAWGNGGNGIAVRTSDSYNGVVFEHCNAQNNAGHGVLLETFAGANGMGQLENFVFRDCTVQANGTNGTTPCEFMVRGFVRMLTINNIWIENIRGIRAGFRTESVTVAPTTYHPGRIRFTGSNTINLIQNAIEFDSCYDCPIDQLTTTAGSLIRYRTFAPTGAQWLINSGSILSY